MGNQTFSWNFGRYRLKINIYVSVQVIARELRNILNLIGSSSPSI